MALSVINKPLDALAFNTAGIGYDHTVKKALEGASIFARAIHLQFLDQEYINTTRTLLEPSAEERGPTGTQCVWVGMLPTEAEKYTVNELKKTGSAPKKGASIGSSNAHVVEYDANAIRIVCVLAHMQNKYYALVDEENGLFAARRVGVDHVFFFASFRDDKVNAREKREAEWSKKIKDFKQKVTEGQGDVPRARTAKDSQRANVQLKRNFGNELRGLLATYLRHPREVYLQAMQDAIKKKDGDFRHYPTGKESVVNLVESKIIVSNEVATTAIHDIYGLWPTLTALRIETSEMLCISQGLVDAGIVLQYSLIRPFIVAMVQGIRELDKESLTEGSVVALAQKTHDWVRLACGEGNNGASVTTDDNFGMFLRSTIENMEALQAYGEEYMDATVSSLGDSYSGLGLEQIIQRYADTPDIESAQLCMKEVCRFLAMEMKHRDEGVIKHLAELIQALKAFRDDLATK